MAAKKPGYWESIANKERAELRRKMLMQSAESALTGAAYESESGKKKKIRKGSIRAGAQRLRDLLRGTRD
jgi:hypothetical protein